MVVTKPSSYMLHQDKWTTRLEYDKNIWERVINNIVRVVTKLYKQKNWNEIGVINIR